MTSHVHSPAKFLTVFPLLPIFRQESQMTLLALGHSVSVQSESQPIAAASALAAVTS